MRVLSPLVPRRIILDTVMGIEPEIPVRANLRATVRRGADPGTPYWGLPVCRAASLAPCPAWSLAQPPFPFPSHVSYRLLPTRAGCDNCPPGTSQMARNKTRRDPAYWSTSETFATVSWDQKELAKNLDGLLILFDCF